MAPSPGHRGQLCTAHSAGLGTCPVHRLLLPPAPTGSSLNSCPSPPGGSSPLAWTQPSTTPRLPGPSLPQLLTGPQMPAFPPLFTQGFRRGGRPSCVCHTARRPSHVTSLTLRSQTSSSEALQPITNSGSDSVPSPKFTIWIRITFPSLGRNEWVVGVENDASSAPPKPFPLGKDFTSP